VARTTCAGAHDVSRGGEHGCSARRVTAQALLHAQSAALDAGRCPGPAAAGPTQTPPCRPTHTAHLAKRDGPAVTQLPRPHPKLVAAVALRVGLATGQRCRPRKGQGKLRALALRRVQPNELRHLRAAFRVACQGMNKTWCVLYFTQPPSVHAVTPGYLVCNLCRSNLYCSHQLGGSAGSNHNSKGRRVLHAPPLDAPPAWRSRSSRAPQPGASGGRRRRAHCAPGIGDVFPIQNWAESCNQRLRAKVLHTRSCSHSTAQCTRSSIYLPEAVLGLRVCREASDKRVVKGQSLQEGQ